MFDRQDHTKTANANLYPAEPPRFHLGPGFCRKDAMADSPSPSTRTAT